MNAIPILSFAWEKVEKKVIKNCFCRSEENIINKKINFNISSEVQKSQIDDEDSDIYDHKDFDENKFIENLKKNEY